MTKKTELLRLAIAAITILAAIAALPLLQGVPVYLDLGVMAAAAVRALQQLAAFFNLSPRLGRTFPRLILATAALFLALALLEAGLEIIRALAARRAGFVMPAAWEKRPADVPGAKAAFYWHDQLHVFDEVGIRRSGPFPPKRPDTFRIMAIGDSLTYGYGVAADQAYPAVLERELSKDFRVEVLNLGVCGYQSENLLWVLRTYAPVLRPDLVVYGVCLNDFLPSRVGAYASNQAWPFPLPAGFKDFMTETTRSGRLFAAAYDQLLLRLGLRLDFYGEVLRDLDGDQQKFGRDVQAMSDFARGQGLPPLVAMVVHQEPQLDSPAANLTRRAEDRLTAAGFTVVPAEPYFTKYNGAQWFVSRWEKHPSAFAHQIFAHQFAAALRDLPAMQPYRK